MIGIGDRVKIEGMDTGIVEDIYVNRIGKAVAIVHTDKGHYKLYADDLEEFEDEPKKAPDSTDEITITRQAFRDTAIDLITDMISDKSDRVFMSVILVNYGANLEYKLFNDEAKDD